MNGQDVSNSSHEDAVRCFQSAQEPIIVEVLRRQPAHGQRTTWKEQPLEKNEIDEKTIDSTSKKEHAIVACPTLVSTAVQTDWAGLLEEEELIPGPLGGDEQTNDSFEDFFVQDIDFEVLVCPCSDSNSKYWVLTLCTSQFLFYQRTTRLIYKINLKRESRQNVALRQSRVCNKYIFFDIGIGVRYCKSHTRHRSGKD